MHFNFNKYSLLNKIEASCNLGLQSAFRWVKPSDDDAALAAAIAPTSFDNFASSAAFVAVTSASSSSICLSLPPSLSCTVLEQRACERLQPWRAETLLSRSQRLEKLPQHSIHQTSSAQASR